MTLRLCSLAARGLWVEMLAIMGISEKVGYLQIGGRPITTEQMAVMAGVTVDQAQERIKELELNGVFSRDENGVIFNRRMAREFIEFQEASECGKRGGNPVLKRKNQESIVQNPETRIQKLEATEGLRDTLKGGVKGGVKGKAIEDIKTFIPPTLQELQSYICEQKYTFSAEAFLAHYETNGWMRGKSKIKDWKACCRTWHLKDKEKPTITKEKTWTSC